MIESYLSNYLILKCKIIKIFSIINFNLMCLTKMNYFIKKSHLIILSIIYFIIYNCFIVYCYFIGCNCFIILYYFIIYYLFSICFIKLNSFFNHFIGYLGYFFKYLLYYYFYSFINSNCLYFINLYFINLCFNFLYCYYLYYLYYF